MPQPATHYLAARFSIPKAQYTLWDDYKPYFSLGSAAPDFFYYPAVPKSVENPSNISWEELANPLHSNGSYDMFCTLLDLAKEAKNRKMFAFAYGYYCHVVTDCIFHPYVYRSTGDYWNTSDFTNETRHKYQELTIDEGVYANHYPKNTNIDRIVWKCSEENSILLDYDIAKQFNTALSIIYSDLYPNEEIPLTDASHPIQLAYSALDKTIALLFEGKSISAFGQKKLISVSSIASKIKKLTGDDFFDAPYGNVNGLPRLSPHDLFKLSVRQCNKIFIHSYKFWDNIGSSSSREFFNNDPTDYLGHGNFNLDTGIPACKNNYEVMRSDSSEQHKFADLTLNLYYENFIENYKNSEAEEKLGPLSFLSL